jgi:hypothetical protein
MSKLGQVTMILPGVRRTPMQLSGGYSGSNVQRIDGLVRKQSTYLSRCPDYEVRREFLEALSAAFPYPARRFFGLLHYLEDTLELEVDLLTTSGLKNPYFRQQVLEERVNIYMPTRGMLAWFLSR